ncbi:putative metal-dependent hydrolase [Brevibacillus phage SecTim467]|uniref:Putative metal-dependent hydrolase n=2 Tax=Jenstvirus jenst TaxID=1982225 RepID=A0A0K2CP14_9CAUD|nr:DNA repair exonuclease [Brevibacillus phage Jenst]ALA07146.1 putative metal-dependent hydrolase [Brevibacillus phage Jenst]ALA07516.1 putative metal-dependent hydrolase [Brevibacillus phage SecTim467]
MKYIQSEFNDHSATHLNVLLLNDLHIGSEYADLNLLDRCINFAQKNEANTRILLNGDYIEGVTKLSKGEIYTQRLSPKEQIDVVVDKLMPVRHLIDGVTIGNHDWRIENETSIDPVEMICRYLGIRDKYLGSRGIVGFSWNKCFYSVDMHHGTGGGSTVAAVENAMKRLWKSDTHVMYCGHWHKEFSKPIKRFAVDHANGTVREEKRWLVCGNTILNTAEYAKRGGFEESFPSQAYLTLSGKRNHKEIDVRWLR